MAIIGLKRPVIAEIDSETTSGTTYKNGQILAKALSANISINNDDAEPLWADDEASETSAGFTDGTIEIGIDDLSDEKAATVLGHTIENIGGVDELVASTEDQPPYLGIGFVRIRMKNNVKSYAARILKKVKFQEPSEETTTKGKSIEWQTPTLTGNILVPADKKWKRQATFATEADAINWIDGILHTTAVSKTALNAKIATISELNEELYTCTTWAGVAVSMYLAGIVSANAEASQAAVDAALASLTAAETALITRA